MARIKGGNDCSPPRADGPLSEATVRAALSGLGFELHWEMGSYVVRDRRATLNLHASPELVTCDSLNRVVALFRLR
jgi:hypothetical protein